jgi:predicted DNA-binding ribbon-helix-helix protein
MNNQPIFAPDSSEDQAHSISDAQHDVAAEIKKRSVVIAGHRTSISLENAFWEALRDLAIGRSISVNQLVTEIDRARQGNLSSAIRTHVLLSHRAQ